MAVFPQIERLFWFHDQVQSGRFPNASGLADQCFIEQPDGCLDLTVPVADFREIKMQILQFGADVEVISPEELRQEVMAEIERMGCLYQQRPHRGERPAKKNPRGGTSDV